MSMWMAWISLVVPLWSGSKLSKTWRSHTQSKDVIQCYQLRWIDRLVLADPDLLRG